MTYWYGTKGQRRTEAVSKALLGILAQGEATLRDVNRASDNFVLHGDLPSLVIGGYRMTLTEESLDCDCGKGFMCPLVEQKPVK